MVKAADDPCHLKTVEEWVRSARSKLARAPFKPPTREAWLLASHVLGLSEAKVLARNRETLTLAQEACLDLLLERRLGGEPVAYLLRRREFYGRVFCVDPRVLIPRPETEHLIEVALSLGLPAAPRVLDLGTGSGCLAVTLALEFADSHLVAVDRSVAALAVARINVMSLGVAARVGLLASDLSTALGLGNFDLVVTNPPYVARRDAPALSPEVRDFEPSLALFAGPDGWDVLSRILRLVADLRSGAWLLSEIGDGQLPELEARLHGLYPGGEVILVDCRSDYAGKPRVVVLKRT